MKTFALYFLLVGLPIAALVLVLNAGNRLKAPVTLEGDWVLQSPQGVAANCLPIANNRRVQIEQSGHWMVFTVYGRIPRRWRGRLNGDSLTVTAGSERCETMVLRAVVEGKSRATAISGRWVPQDCRACPEIPASAAPYTPPVE